jgi:hypothetical protein
MLRFQMMTGALSGSRYRPASHHQFGGGLKQFVVGFTTGSNMR